MVSAPCTLANAKSIRGRHSDLDAKQIVKYIYHSEISTSESVPFRQGSLSISLSLSFSLLRCWVRPLKPFFWFVRYTSFFDTLFIFLIIFSRFISSVKCFFPFQFLCVYTFFLKQKISNQQIIIFEYLVYHLAFCFFRYLTRSLKQEKKQRAGRAPLFCVSRAHQETPSPSSRH